MLRFCLAFAAVWVVFACNLPQAQAQLQTLSRGNADLQWRDAQIKECEKQLADAKLTKELELGIESSTRLAGQVEPEKGRRRRRGRQAS